MGESVMGLRTFKFNAREMGRDRDGSKAFSAKVYVVLQQVD